MPVPAFETVRLRSTSKFAVTVVSAVSVTTHVPVPEQPPPDQPVKTEPAVGAADSVTLVPDRYRAVQVAPQVIPAGLLDTVPVPEPVLAAVSVLHCGDGFIVSDAVPAAPPAGVPTTPIDDGVDGRAVDDRGRPEAAVGRIGVPPQLEARRVAVGPRHVVADALRGRVESQRRVGRRVDAREG